jgi:hypothetical protein
MLHDVVRRWIVGLPRPMHPEAREAWCIARLKVRWERMEYDGSPSMLAYSEEMMRREARLYERNSDWRMVILTMVAGKGVRASSIRAGIKRYEIRRKGGK